MKLRAMELSAVLSVLLLALAGECLGEVEDTLPADNFTIVYQWFKIDFAWPDDVSKANALSSARYVPYHNAPAGLSVFGSRIFISIPRWLKGVPATLNWLPSSGSTSLSPKLHPFPTWEMNKMRLCNALQNVLSMEVDTSGRLWVLDAGRLHLRESNQRPDYYGCAPKLVIFDLNNENKILESFEFPEEVVAKNTSLLSDLVLDMSKVHEKPNDWYAYISDGGNGALVVFSLLQRRSWKLEHPTMKMTKPLHEAAPLGRDLGISGLALSPLRDMSKTLYYSTLSNPNLYSVPTAELQDPPAQLSVTTVGKKSAPSRGLAMDSKGTLYFGLLGNRTVATWNTKKQFSETIAYIDEKLQWPDTFAFDMTDNLWFVTSSLENMVQKRLNVDNPNFRVIKASVGAKSYMYNDWSSGDEDTDSAGGIVALPWLVVVSIVALLFTRAQH